MMKKVRIIVFALICGLFAHPLSAREGHIVTAWHEVVSGDEITIHVQVQDDVNEFWADEYRVYIYDANGNEREHEPDATWKNLDGVTHWFTLSSSWDAAWDIFDLGSSYTIKLYEQSDGFQDSKSMTTPMPSFSVTLNNQGGSGGSSSVTAKYGSPMPSASAPSKSGYTFGGYYTGTGGSGTKYYNSNMSSARNWDQESGDTLYAKWTPKTYTVSLNKQSGSGGSSSVTATYGSAMPSASAPSRTGYTFQGYYTGTGGGGTKYYNSNMSSARNWDQASGDTLYAKWTPRTYTVSLNKQSGSGGSSSVTATYGSAMPSASAPSRTGYTFQGYYTGTGGGGTKYYNSNMSSARNWDQASGDTLHAYWTPRTYTVSFDRQGGSGGSSSVTATYGSAMPSASAPNRTGYTFQGYYTGTGGSGTKYYNSNMSSARNWDQASGDTLYAEWAGLPDLQVTSIEIDDNTDSNQHFQPGESVRLDFLGHNAGNATSQTSISMRWWYGTSANAKTYEIDNGLLGTINGLSAGESEWETDASWTVPSTPGTYWLTVKIDDDNKQNNESDEGNNERTIRFIVDESPSAFSIADANFFNLIDSDGDGYAHEFDIRWLSSVSSGSASVTAEIWADSWELGINDRLVASKTYTITTTASWQSITDISTTAHDLDHRTWDFWIIIKIDGVEVARLDAGDDDDLNDVKLELSGEEEQQVTFKETRITNSSDPDGDGYMSNLTVEWDADVSWGSVQVYAKVYADDIVHLERYLGQSATYTVSGSATGWESMIIPVDASNLSHGTWDFKVEIYRASDDQLMVTWGYNTAPLNNIKVELSSEEDQQVTFKGTRITNTSDPDGDGYFSALTVEWDADVNYSSMQVYAKVYADDIVHFERDLGQSVSYTINGAVTDWAGLVIPVDASDLTHGTWDFKVEVYRASDNQLMATWGYNTAPLNDVKVELLTEEATEQLVLSTQLIEFGAPADTPSTLHSSFQVWNASSGILSYTVDKGAFWITGLTPTSGESTGASDKDTIGFDVQVHGDGLTAGIYEADISVSGNAQNSPQKVRVVLAKGVGQLSSKLPLDVTDKNYLPDLDPDRFDDVDGDGIKDADYTINSSRCFAPGDTVVVHANVENASLAARNTRVKAYYNKSASTIGMTPIGQSERSIPAAQTGRLAVEWTAPGTGQYYVYVEVEVEVDGQWHLSDTGWLDGDASGPDIGSFLEVTENRPVILVHGWWGKTKLDDTIFGDGLLEKDIYGVGDDYKYFANLELIIERTLSRPVRYFEYFSTWLEPGPDPNPDTEAVADDLAQFVGSDDNNLNGVSDFDIACHSYGGLVTRAYDRLTSSRSRKVITFGSPHYGALSADIAPTPQGVDLRFGSQQIRSLFETSLSDASLPQRFLALVGTDDVGFDGGYGNGDGTVICASASLENLGVPVYYVPLSHGGTVSFGMEWDSIQSVDDVDHASWPVIWRFFGSGSSNGQDFDDFTGADLLGMGDGSDNVGRNSHSSKLTYGSINVVARDGDTVLDIDSLFNEEIWFRAEGQGTAWGKMFINNEGGAATAHYMITPASASLDGTELYTDYEVRLELSGYPEIDDIVRVKAGETVVAVYNFAGIPDTPTPMSPVDEAVLDSLTPTLEWSAFNSSTPGRTQAGYELRVRCDTDEDAIVYSKYVASTSDTTHQIPAGKLEYGKHYHWHVRYLDSGGQWSAWSADAPETHQDFYTVQPGTFTIYSDHGSPDPAVGSYSYSNGDTMPSGSVISPVEVSDGVRYRCTGYTGTGDAPLSGSGLQYPSFVIHQDSTIRWNWIAQYMVSSRAGNHGAIQPQQSEWYDEGERQEFVAIPEVDYDVDYWTVNGRKVQSGGTTYELTDITATQMVEVCFKEIVQEETRIIELTGDLSFGNVNVDSDKSQDLRIGNIGNAAMTVSSVTCPQGFSCSWDGVIPAGASRDVSVVFSPEEVRSYSGVITVHADETGGDDTISVSGTGIDTPDSVKHPADSNQDWALEMSEVISYSSAWKQGNTWDGETIDIGYVMRAASLWKQGEVYQYNAASNAPMCWEISN